MFFKKLKIDLPYNAVILLLGVYPEKTIIQKDTCTLSLLQHYLYYPGHGSNINVQEECIKKMYIYIPWNITQP